MDRPQPPVTAYPCNAWTRQELSSGLHTGTVRPSRGEMTGASALLPQKAIRPQASSPGAVCYVTTVSRLMRRDAVNARRDAGVVGI